MLFETLGKKFKFWFHENFVLINFSSIKLFAKYAARR